MSPLTIAESEASCQTCGACCATYRVSFYWAEAPERGLPDDLVEPLTPWHACLRGTNMAKPRCAALVGHIGTQVACSVYPQRPSPCREVILGDDRCRKARRRHGLPIIADGIDPVGAR